LQWAPPADVAALHFRHALVLLGRYASTAEGVWSPFVGAIMYASEDQWRSTLDAVSAQLLSDPAEPGGPVDDAASLLRSMGASLTVANVAARDARLNELQQQELSNELLVRLAWPLNLGNERVRLRFDACFTRLLDRVAGDLEATWLTDRLRSDVAWLKDAWKTIDQPASQVKV
jgi:hypothetical protein